MEDKDKIYYKNPKIEILFGFYGNTPIPTKQDKFKPLKAFEIDKDGTEIELKNLYEKKDDKTSIEEMKNLIADYATTAFKKKGIIKKPSEVEVILSFSVQEKRFKQVDIDNLTKTVLDGLTGVAFEDDSQVSSILSSKHIHGLKVDAVMIGITELRDNYKGFRNEIKLFGPDPDNF